MSFTVPSHRCLILRENSASSRPNADFTLPDPPTPPSLANLSLSASSFVIGAATSGTIIGATVGSTIEASGLPSGLTVNGAARTWAWSGSGSAATGNITLTETLAGYFNSPHDNTVSYAIVVPPTLGALSFSTTFQQGTAVSGTITGATNGSTISTNIPGITVNSGARTYTGTPTSSGTISNAFVETLAGATNTPRNTSVNVAAAPVLGDLTFSTTFRAGIAVSGSITGATPGSTITTNIAGISVNSGARTYSGTPSSAGTVANGFVETLTGAANTPHNTSVTVGANPVLATLTFSTSFDEGIAVSGTISGATAGSTITCNIPGITVNSGARTYSGTPTANGTISNAFVETLAGASGSPKSTAQYLRPAPDPALTSPYRLVLPRGSMPRGLSTHATYDRRLSSVITRTRAVAPVEIRAVFYNGAITNAGAHDEVPNANSVNVRAACERLGSTNVVKKWKFGGNDVGVMAPGEILISDPITGEDWTGTPGSTWPANTYFAAKTEAGVTTPSTQSIPAEPSNHLTTSVATGGVTGTRTDQSVGHTAANAADQVYATGAIVTTGGSSSVSSLVPIAYIGTYADGATGLPAVMWIGDSIGDDAYPNALNFFSAGGVFIEKALRTRTFPFSKVAMGSRSAIGWNGNNPGTKALMAWSSHVILQWGVNGLSADNPDGYELYDIVKQIGYDARVRGVKKVVGLRLTPTTTSSNSFVDAAGQSYRTGSGPGENKQIFNDALVAGAGSSGPGVDIVVDTGGAMQDPVDPFKIITNGTPNYYISAVDAPVGIHPTEAGHALMATPLAAEMSSWTLT